MLKRSRLAALAGGAAALFTVAMVSPAMAADGKKIFTDYKCNGCHTIAAEGIKVDGKPEKEAPDLSGVGAKHDKKWIAGYLLKKQEKDGKKHEKRWSGSTDELKTIATWLESLKTAK